ncbi:MAG: hypothetical protein IJU76_03460 [Desulfovibrionaceae bacterium]|nr:hypothetical protein [Desulfovibrionaceae bacterium]
MPVKKTHCAAVLILLLALAAGCSVFAPVESRFTGNIPYAAKRICKTFDSQLVMRYGRAENENERISPERLRSEILLMGTTAVNVNNLSQACPLSRQMTEEISSRLVHMGYRYEELRKGKDIRFDRATGELILTRTVRNLTVPYGRGQAIIAGTYVISNEDVRFTFSLLHAQTNEVIAKASATVPITPDIEPLLDESPVQIPGQGSGSRMPNTYIRLR